MKRRPINAKKHSRKFNKAQKRRRAINTPGSLSRGGIRL